MFGNRTYHLTMVRSEVFGRDFNCSSESYLVYHVNLSFISIIVFKKSDFEKKSKSPKVNNADSSGNFVNLHSNFLGVHLKLGYRINEYLSYKKVYYIIKKILKQLSTDEIFGNFG